MKVAKLTISMSRRAGGLFGAMRDLSANLGQRGCRVEVFAGEDADSSRDRSAWEATPVHVLPVRGPRAFCYQPGLGAELRAFAPDVLHVHGLWCYPSLAARRQGRARIVSPHGMLDPWAVGNARWKKWIAAVLFETDNLRGARCVHALCAAEAEAIRAFGVAAPIAIIPNGVEPPSPAEPSAPPAWRERLPRGARVLLFLGRIHPKKGLLPLVEAMGSLPRRGATEGWHLVIAGWDQDGHEASVRTAVQALGLGRRVHFIGPVLGEAKAATLAAADAFVLPSVSEGLPLAVLEAWAFGLPALITDACNLPEGLDAGAAIPIASDARSIAAGIRLLATLSDGERAAIGARGRHLVADRFDWRRIAADMAELYAWADGSGPAPACLVRS